MRVNPGLDQLGDYPFHRLNALLADVTPPAGLAPVAMHLGEPQGAPPGFVAATVSEHADLWNRYPPPAGSPDFRAAAAAWLTRRYALPAGMIDADRHIVAAAGSREALFHAALVAVPGGRATGIPEGRDAGGADSNGPGDGSTPDVPSAAAPREATAAGSRPAVLMPNPMYHVYYGAAVIAGAEPVPVAATAETGFLPDYGALDAALLDRTVLAYLCTPGNPQGAVASLEQLVAMIALARRHDFLLALDECYSEIWRGSPPPGGLQACAETGGDTSNVLVFHSLSKRSSAPGLRAGFAAGDASAIAAMGRIGTYGGAQIPGPIQAAAAALWRDEAHVAANRAHYEALFALARRILGNRAGYRDSPAGFFLWLDVGDGAAAARRAWAEAAVKVMPGAFMARPDPASGENPGARYIRIALVHDLATAEAGLTRLAGALDG